MISGLDQEKIIKLVQTKSSFRIQYCNDDVMTVFFEGRCTAVNIRRRYEAFEWIVLLVAYLQAWTMKTQFCDQRNWLYIECRKFSAGLVFCLFLEFFPLRVDTFWNKLYSQSKNPHAESIKGSWLRVLLFSCLSAPLIYTLTTGHSILKRGNCYRMRLRQQRVRFGNTSFHQFGNMYNYRYISRIESIIMNSIN